MRTTPSMSGASPALRAQAMPSETRSTSTRSRWPTRRARRELLIAASHETVIQDYSTDAAHSVRVGRRMLEFHNTDLLVRSPAWNIVVQKTGYITEAGRCLVVKALIRGRAVVSRLRPFPSAPTVNRLAKSTPGPSEENTR